MKPQQLINGLSSLAGAVVGAILGYYGFGWMWSNGFYAIVLPSALIGVGCGLASRTNSIVRGILCGLAGLVWGLFTECSYRPLPDTSFRYFLTHLSDLNSPQVTLGLIGAGAFLSFWMGKGHFFGTRGRGPVLPPSREV